MVYIWQKKWMFIFNFSLLVKSTYNGMYTDPSKLTPVQFCRGHVNGGFQPNVIYVRT